jgi:hypothetical protein
LDEEQVLMFAKILEHEGLGYDKELLGSILYATGRLMRTTTKF